MNIEWELPKRAEAPKFIGQHQLREEKKKEARTMKTV